MKHKKTYTELNERMAALVDKAADIALGQIYQSIGENCDLGSLIESPISDPSADKAFETLRDSLAVILQCAEQKEKEHEAEAIESAAEAIAAALTGEAALDAERFEAVFSLAAQKVRERVQDGLGFEQLVGGTVSKLGEAIKGETA